MAAPAGRSALLDREDAGAGDTATRFAAEPLHANAAVAPTTKENEMNRLGDFSAGLDAASKRKEQERLEWQAKLGEPYKFVPDEDPEQAAKGFGRGFFKAEWGVIVAQRFANGYNQYSCQQYSHEFIQLLVETDGQPG